MLELRDLRKNFGQTEIIRGASLHVAQGERCAIIGPNGAGKSTLFSLISGQCAPSSGAIRLRGKDVAGMAPQQVNRLGLARSFQVSSLFSHLTVYEHLRCAALWPMGYGYSFWHRLDGLRAVTERCDAVLEQIGLQRQRNAPAAVLSYAEQRALEIGVTIAGGADVILLDEPTAGMSRSESDAAVHLIRSVTQGKTLLMVEHDMEVVFGLADKIAVLVYGQVIACGTPAEVRADPAVQQAYLGTAVGLA